MARRIRRRIAAAIAFAMVAAFALAAGAAPEIDSNADAGRAWKGRFCTQTGCTGSRMASWSQIAGFGAAVAATGLLARRRDQRRTVTQRNELEEPGTRPPAPIS